ncbi:unnamed protein product [Adineta steineri]|uniref:F-box domain-containing protein n=3 Tax=Adineta steineri TaxID=433720 RepID=A0A815R9V2_9BILA|nr:unnamed protein product [Adineta steineri]
MALKLSCLSRKRKRFNINQILFDDLTNEIYYEIFDYLTYNDIIKSFSNLNNRFKQIIGNYPHNINLEIDKNIPRFIRSLKITLNSQLDLFNSLKTNQFLSLRSITISNLRYNEINHILNIIPSIQLEYIYIGICVNDQKEDFSKILSSLQIQILKLTQYRLKSCRFKDQFSVPIQDLPEKFPQLEHLQIKSCKNFSYLSQILNRTTKIRSIDVSIRESCQQTLVISNQYYLTYLILRPFHECTIDELNHFIQKCCFYLKKLIIQIYIYTVNQPKLLNINKYQWINIFPKQLNYFYLKSIPTASIHLDKNFSTQYLENPLNENINLISDQNQEHICEIIIDGILIKYWNKDIQ